MSYFARLNYSILNYMRVRACFVRACLHVCVYLFVSLFLPVALCPRGSVRVCVGGGLCLCVCMCVSVDFVVVCLYGRA